MSYCTNRTKNLNSLIHEEVSKIIAKEVEFTDCIVTVTRVDTSPDWSKSNVFITIMPNSKEKEALKLIYSNIYEIQKIINKKLKVKHVPRICFNLDEGAKNLYKIDQFSA